MRVKKVSMPRVFERPLLIGSTLVGYSVVRPSIYTSTKETKLLTKVKGYTYISATRFKPTFCEVAKIAFGTLVIKRLGFVCQQNFG